jgi:lysophospholipase L1-like esterase
MPRLLRDWLSICLVFTCVGNGLQTRAFSQANSVAPGNSGKALEAEVDILVYGGTAGGVIAAVQAARMGKSVLLIEPGKHLGGMTSGGLGATDFKVAEAVGGVAREFYQRVKAHYARPEAWIYERLEDYTSHRHDPASDVMFHFEPRVAEQILRQMLAETQTRIIHGERLDLQAGVEKNDTRIRAVRMESGKIFQAKQFIDATYEGDLMAKAGVAYHVGREANSVHGETANGVQTQRVPYNGHAFFRPISPYVDPQNPRSGLLFGVQSAPPGPEGSGDARVQAYCFRLCLTEVPENRVPFPKPAGYDPAHYELLLRYLLSEGTSRTFPDHPQPREIESPALGYRPYIVIMPNRKTDMNSKGAISSNLVGENYAYPDGDYATREAIIAAHRSWHQGLLWFMQHDPRVPAKYQQPLQSWGLAKDEFVDTEHWPHQIYVREARRMIGDMVMTEHHCAGALTAEDSIGLGAYPMDSHVNQRYVDSAGWVRNEGNIGGRVPVPYPISYRSLIPKREECENLLVPVCCSASHVAYGSLRMEPVYMILGQSAATAAAMAVSSQVAIQDVPYARLRQRLTDDGQRLNWPIAGDLRTTTTTGSRTTPQASVVPIEDQPGLPRVLLIGDSVSMGYTIPTRELLAGKANLHRIPSNGGATKIGLAKLDTWLGDGPWDVIHFNFGLHDAKLLPEGINHAPLDVYQANLEKVVSRLKATGAKLIWATTTPVPNGGYLSPIRRFGNVDEYNRLALEVMAAHGVAVDDLNAAMAPYMSSLGREKDVHFSEAGYEFLAKHVAQSIEAALQEP